MRPRRPTSGIMSGVAIATSKSVKPSSTRLARSSAPTTSAPASCASRAASPWAKTAIVTSRPRPLGSAIVPRSCSSAWRTFSPVRMCTSIDSSNLARRELLDRARSPRRASARARGRPARAASMHALAAVRHQTTSTPIERAVPAMIFAAASRSLALRSANFCSRDLAQLRLGDRADLVAVRLGRALVEPDRLADQVGGRRRLGDEGERAVLVDGDHDRDHGAGVLLRSAR